MGLTNTVEVSSCVQRLLISAQHNISEEVTAVCIYQFSLIRESSSITEECFNTLSLLLSWVARTFTIEIHLPHRVQHERVPVCVPVCVAVLCPGLETRSACEAFHWLCFISAPLFYCEFLGGGGLWNQDKGGRPGRYLLCIDNYNGLKTPEHLPFPTE